MTEETYLVIAGVKVTLELLFFWKVALSTLVGSIIGRERKRNEKPGGSRTFALVCLGSTIMAVLSLELQRLGYNFDFSRLMAYGIASIGFLGSGIIIQNKSKVEGLTSASTLWAVVPVGFLIGLGMYQMAILSALFIYFILESKYTRKRRKTNERSKSIK